MSSEVVINGRFEGRRLTGVERYASEILRCLGADTPVIKPAHPLAGIRGHAWEQLVLPRQLGDAQYLWSPANTGPLAVSRQTVTIHDLSVLEHPEWFTANFRLWYRVLLPRLAHRARRVLTVSEHSRRSILNRFGLPLDKVIAIPNGVNLQHFHPTDPGPMRAKYGLPAAYILFVGSLDPRKNLERLMQAWARLIEFQHVQLIIVGAPGTVFQPVTLRAWGRRTRFLGYVPDDDLPGLYAGATFFVMPSLHEGFGLSVLEAMACGTPVISSNAGALPEVTGGAAIQVDPTSVEAMAEAMRTLLIEDGLRNELRRKGTVHAYRFPWERSAQAIWKTLTEDAA